MHRENQKRPNTFVRFLYIDINKIKNKKNHFQPSNTQIVERGKIDTPNAQIHDHSLSGLGTGTSIKSGGVKEGFNKTMYTYKRSQK
jgi:hypothetical protein